MAAIDRKETAPEQESQGADRLERLEASYRSFRQRVLNPAMIDREIRFHRTEWTRLDCRRVVFAEEEKAREAALCIREDGSALDDVASGAGAGVETQTVFLEEIEPQLHDHFLGARKGDLVGPLKQGEEFSLYLVMEKVLPSEKEAADVERAEQNILNRLVEREINERVKWAALPRVNA